MKPAKTAAAKLPDHLVFRNGIAQFRRRVPRDVAGQHGMPPIDVRISLGVGTLREALPLLKIEEARFEARVAEARAKIAEANRLAAGGPRLLTQLTNSEIRDRISGTLSVISSMFYKGNQPKTPGDFLAAICEIWNVEFTPELAAQIHNAVAGVATIEEHTAMAGTFPDLNLSWKSREIREIYDTKPVIPQPEPVLITLDHAISQFMAEPRRRGKNKDSTRNYIAAFRIFKSIFGGYRDIKSFTRADLKDFRNIAMSLPVYAERHPRFEDLGYKGLAALTEQEQEEKPDVRTLEVTTINKYISNVARLFEYAVSETWIRQNPGNDLTLPLSQRKTDGRTDFSDEQLSKIFHAGYKTDGINFLPLLSLYQGVRPNELAQLDSQDIMQVGDIWCIRFSSWTYLPDGSRVKGDKSLKNSYGQRIVPIHEDILRVGFIAYAVERQKSGARKLFDATRWGDSHWDSIRGYFTEMLETAGCLTTRTKYYSFRHTWQTRMVGMKTDQNHRRQLCGWSRGDATDDRVYTHQLDVIELAKTLNLLKFDLPFFVK